MPTPSEFPSPDACLGAGAILPRNAYSKPKNSLLFFLEYVGRNFLFSKIAKNLKIRLSHLGMNSMEVEVKKRCLDAVTTSLQQRDNVFCFVQRLLLCTNLFVAENCCFSLGYPAGVPLLVGKGGKKGARLVVQSSISFPYRPS